MLLPRVLAVPAEFGSLDMPWLSAADMAMASAAFVSSESLRLREALNGREMVVLSPSSTALVGEKEGEGEGVSPGHGCGTMRPSCQNGRRGFGASSASGNPIKRFTYVTLLLGTSDWWKGVVGLAKSLKAVKSQYGLMAAVGAECPEEHRNILRRHGCGVQEIEAILPPKGAKDEDFPVEYYKLMYTKLRIWEMVDYDRIIYLDADMLLLRNIDHLFWALPEGAIGAALDCFCEGWSHPIWRRRDGFCQIDPLKRPWPGAGPQPPRYFNMGMIVAEPCRKVFKRIMDALAVSPPTPLAEQDLLNDVLAECFVCLPNEYNFVLPLLWHHHGKVQLDRVSVVHYSVSGAKPWRFDPTKENLGRPEVKWLVDMWQKIYSSGGS